MALKDFAGGAVETTLAADISSGATSATIAAATGWPSGGASGTFGIAVGNVDPETGRFTTNVEKIRVTSRTGTTLSSLTRGIDGTSAAAHVTGETVRHILLAEDIDEVNAHMFDTGRHDHTQYLRSADHAAIAHTAAMLGTDSVGSDEIAANAVGSSELAAGAVTAGKIAVGGISAANQFAAGVVDAAAIATDAVGSAEIAADAVGSSEIAANAVGASELADNAVDILAITAAARDILIPPGVILPYGAAAAPTGWLLCDGAAVSRTTFATLFGIIGTTYGAGNGTSTFNVPDLRQRFPLGKAASGTGATLGGTGGAIDHVHGLDTSSSHARVAWLASGAGVRGARKNVPGWTSTHSTGAAAGSGAAETTGTELGGSSDTENPPYQVVQYIIRTGNTS